MSSLSSACGPSGSDQIDKAATDTEGTSSCQIEELATEVPVPEVGIFHTVIDCEFPNLDIIISGARADAITQPHIPPSELSRSMTLLSTLPSLRNTPPLSGAN